MGEGSVVILIGFVAAKVTKIIEDIGGVSPFFCCTAIGSGSVTANKLMEELDKYLAKHETEKSKHETIKSKPETVISRFAIELWMVIVGLRPAEKMVGTAASVVKTPSSAVGAVASVVKTPSSMVGTTASMVKTTPSAVGAVASVVETSSSAVGAVASVAKTPPSVAVRTEAVRYFFANYLALSADNPSFIVNFAETYISNMRKICIFLYALLLCLSSYGQARRNTLYQQYINQYKDLAIQQMLRYRIPASITLAQGLLESGAGRSDLAIKGNNHFGIKCHDWTGATTYHDDDLRQECFRAYNTVLESYEDHSRFLSTKPRYRKLFSLSQTDYRGWAHGLKAAGYATNPQYAYKLINIIELYGLDQYDRAKTYDRYIARHSGTERISPDNPTLHPIYYFNKNYYIYAREGETFKKLSKEIGISARKLAKYNERDKRETLHKGDIIYLKKKQKRAPKEFKHRPHVVKAGDSMYLIAQKYGMRLESLYKKNGLGPDYQIRVGDTLRVR